MGVCKPASYSVLAHQSCYVLLRISLSVLTALLVPDIVKSVTSSGVEERRRLLLLLHT